MADSMRKQIRHEVSDLLLSANTDVGAKVYPSRARSLWATEQPCICVYTLNDQAELMEQTPPRYKRTLDVAIEIIVAMDDDYDDAVDDIAEQVEQVLLQNNELPTTGATIKLAGTEITLRAEGDKVHASAIVRASAEYEQEFTVADDDLDDFLKADVEWNTGGQQHVDDRASDEINLPQ